MYIYLITVFKVPMIEFISSHYLQRYHSADVIYNTKKCKIPKEIIKQIMVITQ